ncbi:hypothetical protein [Streptomyces virginiae]|uniref:hypothetical protein n=1 Tax=Streptomyces virginiae TaxID=1961 RepID=UPI003665888F
MRKRALGAAVAAAGVAGMVLGGCSTPAQERSEYENLQVSTPLDDYLPSGEQMETLHRAEARLTNECLKRLAFEDNPLPEGGGRGRADERHPEFIVIPVRQAKDRGYSSLPDIGLVSDSWDAKTTKIQQDLLKGRVKEFLGNPVPDGGCNREAAEQITRGSEIPDKISGGGVVITRRQDAAPTGLGEAHVGIIRLDAINRTKQDSRVLEMVKHWADCMADRGHPYKTPEDAANDKRWTGEGVSQQEKDTAVADMQCKQQVKYLDVMVEVQSGYERQVIHERSAELAILHTNVRKWVENASAATARSS